MLETEVKCFKSNVFLQTLNNSMPVFPFELKDGISQQRIGLLILQNNGIADF